MPQLAQQNKPPVLLKKRLKRILQKSRNLPRDMQMARAEL